MGDEAVLRDILRADAGMGAVSTAEGIGDVVDGGDHGHLVFVPGVDGLLAAQSEVDVRAVSRFHGTDVHLLTADHRVDVVATGGGLHVHVSRFGFDGGGLAIVAAHRTGHKVRGALQVLLNVNDLVGLAGNRLDRLDHGVFELLLGSAGRLIGNQNAAGIEFDLAFVGLVVVLEQFTLNGDGIALLDLVGAVALQAEALDRVVGHTVHHDGDGDVAIARIIGGVDLGDDTGQRVLVAGGQNLANFQRIGGLDDLGRSFVDGDTRVRVQSLSGGLVSEAGRELGNTGVSGRDIGLLGDAEGLVGAVGAEHVLGLADGGAPRVNFRVVGPHAVGGLGIGQVLAHLTVVAGDGVRIDVQFLTVHFGIDLHAVAGFLHEEVGSGFRIGGGSEVLLAVHLAGGEQGQADGSLLHEELVGNAFLRVGNEQGVIHNRHLALEGTGLGVAGRILNGSGQGVGDLFVRLGGQIDRPEALFGALDDLDGVNVDSPGDFKHRGADHDLADYVVVALGGLCAILIQAVQISRRVGQSGLFPADRGIGGVVVRGIGLFAGRKQRNAKDQHSEQC